MIFSTEFSPSLMRCAADFIREYIRQFYFLSNFRLPHCWASNPITQIALTLPMEFTYVEYYVSRDGHQSVCPNSSFLFTNELTPNMRSLASRKKNWATSNEVKYDANNRLNCWSIIFQTSGRSLCTARNLDFNDIERHFQGAIRIYINCNSLATNAMMRPLPLQLMLQFRRAMAFKLISTQELGLTKWNPIQAFIIENWQTDRELFM